MKGAIRFMCVGGIGNPPTVARHPPLAGHLSLKGPTWGRRLDVAFAFANHRRCRSSAGIETANLPLEGPLRGRCPAGQGRVVPPTFKGLKPDIVCKCSPSPR